MDYIEIDTEAIKVASDDIIILTNELNELFEDTFQTIDSMVKKEDIWLGNTAEQFALDTLYDKVNYAAFKNSLNEYARYLSDYSAEFNTKIAGLKNNCQSLK